MGTRTEHAPGTFSWVDLTTNDSESAKSFYGSLFDWEFDGFEIPGGGGTYTMCKVGGENVAAIAPATDKFPPHWNSYVTVESADDAAARAAELGANLIEQPFDVMEAGRMALFEDPTGAALCVWQPNQSIGATRVNDPGSLTWNELHSPDPAAAVEFYAGLFGWGTQEMPMGDDSVYTVVTVGERSNGGVMASQQGEPSHWVPYFAVESRDDTADLADEIGGRSYVRMEMPQGKIAFLSDPQGSPFGIWEGQTDD